MAASIEELQRVLLAQCGDRAALETLLRGMAPSLRRYVASLVGPADADDVLQDSLVIVIRKLGGLDDPGAFRPWAYRIASREAFRCLKRRRLDLVRNEDEQSLGDLPAPFVPSSELLRDLLSSDAVSPASRAVLVLHFQEGLSLPEAAAVLDIPVGTAKSRLAYGLAALRRQMNVTGGSHGR